MFGAFFPVLIEPIQVVRQPRRADFQESKLELGKSHGQALANDTGKLQQQSYRESIGVHLCKRRQPRRADFMGIAARTMDPQYGSQLFSFRIHRIIKTAAQGNRQAHGQNLKAF